MAKLRARRKFANFSQLFYTVSREIAVLLTTLSDIVLPFLVLRARIAISDIFQTGYKYESVV